MVNGYADEYAYQLGLLDRSLPFTELKRRSLIRRSPHDRIGTGFSADIRRSLPG
ncbi:MAG: hypothetical protein WB524_17105 [Acidobacteriaceae bacterium]